MKCNHYQVTRNYNNILTQILSTLYNSFSEIFPKKQKKKRKIKKKMISRNIKKIRLPDKKIPLARSNKNKKRGKREEELIKILRDAVKERPPRGY